MKFFLHLLMAVALALGSSLAAAQAPECCPGPDCDVVQCLDMGCAPAPAVLGAAAAAASGMGSAPREYAPQLNVYMTQTHGEPWTPPD